MSIAWKSGDLCVFQPSAGVPLRSFHARSSYFRRASPGFVNQEPFLSLFISVTHPTAVASSPIKCVILMKLSLEETQFAYERGMVWGARGLSLKRYILEQGLTFPLILLLNVLQVLRMELALPVSYHCSKKSLQT